MSDVASVPDSKRSRPFRDNGISIAFGALLLLTLVGQAASGLADYNDRVSLGGLPHLSMVEYLTSSDFGVDVAENWQSEYLQFFLYIVLTVYLVQRGSPESKQLDQTGRERQGPEGGALCQRRLTRLGQSQRLATRPVLALPWPGHGSVLLPLMGGAACRRSQRPELRADTEPAGPSGDADVCRLARLLEPHPAELAV